MIATHLGGAIDYAIVVSFGSDCCGTHKQADDTLQGIVDHYGSHALGAVRAYWGKEGLEVTVQARSLRFRAATPKKLSGELGTWPPRAVEPRHSKASTNCDEQQFGIVLPPHDTNAGVRTGNSSVTACPRTL